ncbi:DNA helicase [Microbacterium sp. LRZ72]|uniref:DNA helicase n=1 Tax=Microbacterium sp. LRZ72 TaxID=2942481 RepID=UPI0029A35B98|nr:DNA helicase [Microbacterium sp. LRZ72]MDX2376247.1 DNA helicase [Microbacterium sp. LRZ72]
MSLSRKRKKELRKLQDSANKLWESQQVLVGEAANVAREARRQLGHFSREQVGPAVQGAYESRVLPAVDKTVRYSRHTLDDRVIPAVGSAVGSAMSVWDTANDTRARLAAGRGFELPSSKKFNKKADGYRKKATKAMSKKLSAYSPAPQKSGIGVGGVIAIVFGAVAALGVLYAAWQTLRADDELWVADDPLAAPDA